MEILQLKVEQIYTPVQYVCKCYIPPLGKTDFCWQFWTRMTGQAPIQTQNISSEGQVTPTSWSKGTVHSATGNKWLHLNIVYSTNRDKVKVSNEWKQVNRLPCLCVVPLSSQSSESVTNGLTVLAWIFPFSHQWKSTTQKSRGGVLWL